jgi:DNA ligase-1
MAVLLLLLVLLTGTAQAEPTALMLANNYSNRLDLNDYWVSEKYDGYRAYWDGQQLLSRAGNRFLLPDWFVENFPKQPMDGELWLGRGQFQTLASVVKSADKDDPRWRQVRFMVFDLPAEQGSFDQRLRRLKSLLQSVQVGWLVVVQQEKIASNALLMRV